LRANPLRRFLIIVQQVARRGAGGVCVLQQRLSRLRHWERAAPAGTGGL